MNKPWSIIDDEALARFKLLAETALRLGRGCDCEYDYRCGNCTVIIDAYDIAKKILAK